MSQESFDPLVREYYRARKLSPEKLVELRSMIESGRRRSSARGMPHRWVRVLVAAVIALSAVSGVLYVVQRLPDPVEAVPSVADRLASEAAMCHNQNLTCEVLASDFDELRAKMDRVSFNPVEPARFHGRGMTLVGARYTMLHGQPAIQLVLEGPDGSVCTLYQTRPVAELASLEATTREIDGLTVDLWNEKGLVMVLAR